MKLSLLLLGLMASGLVATDKAYSQSKPLGVSGPYLGQTLPGLKPQTFAPNIISTPNWEMSGVFSPDLTEFYFIREVESNSKLNQEFVVMENKNDQWFERVISDRVGQPFISPNGQTMHLGLRYKERKNQGWSEIKTLGADFHSFHIMSMTSSKKGTFVFDDASNNGNGLLRYSQLIDGQRQEPKPLAKSINTGEYNAHPFIAPDESYIIWDGQRNSPIRNADLFISFRQDDGSWGEAIKMGPEINTPVSEWGARVSPDGKYLFFNRKVGEFKFRQDNGEVETIPNTDVFWVDAKIIDQLKTKASKKSS